MSVLSEQVGAQSDKIKDLESLLDDKRRKLDSTEEMLQDVSKNGRRGHFIAFYIGDFPIGNLGFF